MAFCRTKRWHVFRVRSHHFSTYMMHLFRDRLLPSTIISHRTSVASVLRHWVYDPAADLHIKLLVRAFRLERPVQRRIMPKWDLHLFFFIFTETAVSISKWGRWGILGWRHSPKMADAEMCVPGSIGFGKTALVPARIEYSARQMCVRKRKHSTPTCGISGIRNLASWRRISFRRRPLSGSRYRGLPTWIRRNRRDSWSSTYGTRKESGGGGGVSQGWGQIRFIKYKYKYIFFRSFKYKYKYTGKNLIKYKYKYSSSNTNTNTQWGRGKIAAILQMTYWNLLYCKKIVYIFKFHWKLFPKVQSTISLHWFR